MRTYRSLLLASALLPPLFVLQHWGPYGVPAAEGCSGAGPVNQPLTVQVSEDSQPGGIRIGRDGLIVLQVTGSGVSPTGGLDLVVTNAEASPIAGEQRVLQLGPNSVHVGWKAETLLDIGSKLVLSATFTGEQAPALEVELEVKSEPTPLPQDGLTLGLWVDVAHGVGEPTTCPARGSSAPGGCITTPPGAQLTLPSSEQILRSVSTHWTRMSPDTFVAWEARIELPGGQEPVAPLAPHPFVGKSAAELPPEDLGRLVFPEATQDYCAVLVVEDLWSGDEVESEVCGSPPADVQTTRDYPLHDCAQPPNEELTWAWCQPQQNWFAPACAQYLGGGGGPPMMQPIAGASYGGGAGGLSPSDAGSGGAPSANPNSGGTSPTLTPSETSSGCQLGGKQATPAAIAAFAAALVAAWRLRRRRLVIRRWG